MSNLKNSKEMGTYPESQQKKPNYLAVINENKCYGNGDCMKVCKVKAIKEGPKRIPNMCACAGFVAELDPGIAIINAEICNGCGDCVAVCSRHAIEMVAV